MKRIFTYLFLLCLSCLQGQQPTLKQLLGYSFPSELTASATTDQVAWVENAEGVRNIYYARGPEYLPVRLTDFSSDDGQALGELAFDAMGQNLWFVRGGSANRQGEYPNPTSMPDPPKQMIYRISLGDGANESVQEGHHPLPLGERVLFLKKGQPWVMDAGGENAKALFEVRGSVSDLTPSPDQSKLAFVNSRGDHSFIGVYEFSSGDFTFLDPGIDRDSNPAWSPNGDQVAFLRIPYTEPELFVPQRAGLPFSIVITKVGGGQGTTVFTADPGTGSVFREIAADNQLFWTSRNTLVFPWEKDGWTHLYELPASGGAPKLITPGPGEVQYVSQGPDRNTLVFNSNQEDRNRPHLASYDGNLRTLTRGESLEWSPVVKTDGSVFFLGSGATEPANVKRLSAGKPVAITRDINYPSESLVVPKPVELTASDGHPSYGQLFVPPGLKPGEKAPAVLFFHGGSRRQMFLGFHHRDYYHYAYAMNQYLAQSGYIVLSVNYRSGIGYGMEFREALDYGAGGASEYRDVLAAADFLQNHPQVDASRIGLWGGSYGGYLTALGLARNSDRFRAGVDIHGVYDWNNVIQGFMPSYNRLAKPEFAKKAYDSSPIAVMEGWKSPVLLIHGDDDRNVPFSETVLKAGKLRELGVEFEQLVFPDEVHGFLLHDNWYRAYQATRDFFDRKLD
ncbi:prolyl oligopeptidase family serine peptidase [Robiginitalea sp. SC105]|uniref:S9 family peptidase n=1 Tax=Robiginitalea sp. SC105 TaxID=2762332 RepID=UPI0016395D3C|nr:prolyl oligopeptidase family serine peptidase [Robiginitalea sp. SC105]MBC2838592.1 S9 family peptidase [Robiginitalea sp. SC105]